MSGATSLKGSGAEAAGSSPGGLWHVWVGILVLVYLLLLSVGLIGSGFKLASGGADAAKNVFSFATNPIAGLLVGIFATALVQSSSTVTAVIVGIVAHGQISLSMAVPMIMGANIGTTITNLLVSLGHIGQKQEFRRAFQAATIHDAFNLIAVAIFLPLELAFGLLQRCAQALSGLVPIGGGGVGFNPVRVVTKPVEELLHNKAGSGLFDALPSLWGGILLAVTGVLVIFGSISLLSRLLRTALQGRAERIFHAAIGRGPLMGMFAGLVVTVLVQSSSTTTSLIVPMAAAGLMTINQVLPFTLGANIGTCVTAMLAATAGGDTPELSQAGVGIALVHLLFNLFATVLIYGLPPMRRLPILCSTWLAAMAIHNRGLAIAFIVLSYFGIPGLILWLSSGSAEVPEPPPEPIPHVSPLVPVTTGDQP